MCAQRRRIILGIRPVWSESLLTAWSIRKTRLFKYTENFTTKKWKFSEKNADMFHISAQNIDCGYSLEPPRRGGSNEYPQSMFLSRNKKNNIYPCKPQFYYIKVGFKGVKIILVCFRDGKLGSLAVHWAHSEDADQTGRMPRLIWVFAGHTCHFVGFVMRWLEWLPVRKWVCSHLRQIIVVQNNLNSNSRKRIFAHVRWAIQISMRIQNLLWTHFG